NRRALVPVDLTWQRRLHAIGNRRRRQRKSSRPDISNRWIGNYAVGASGSCCVHCSSTKHESAGIRAQTDGRVVLVLLRQEDPPARSNINDIGASPDNRSSVARYVVRKTEARGKIILVAVPHAISVFA